MPASDSITWGGVLVRLLASLVLVFLTWNAEGWSYYNWAIQPLLEGAGNFSAIKFLAGALLVAAWVVFLQATRRSIGLMGAVLVAAIAGGVIWLLISSGIVTASSGRGLARVVLIAISVILAVGMSWSHMSRRLTGQADTDVVD
ncbi:MAG TPA: DUF6524 family protein [Gemmatimonadaceae bacterium]|nr:DUF6524 family protein [Gemmatimonadaceae bacterium]